MGWFEESDSDDDDGRAKKAPPGLFHPDDEVAEEKDEKGGGGGSGGGADDDDDEVDPLDAFMTGIDAAASAGRSGDGRGGKAAAGGEAAGGRMDVENEEEATAHWEERPGGSSSTSGGAAAEGAGRRLLPGRAENGSAGGAAAATSYARTAAGRDASSSLASTFHRAGQANKKKAGDNDDDDDENDLHGPDGELDVEALAKLKRQQQIDPLSKVEHGSVAYGHFERKFFDPTDTDGGREWRRDNDVVCSVNVDPVRSFALLGSAITTGAAAATGGCEEGGGGAGVFPPELMDCLSRSNLHTPTLVQCQTLPVALSGRDVIVTASTGSGKTLSYALPLTVHCIAQDHVEPGVDGPIGLVLTPTRELAAQVHKVCHKLLRSVEGRAVCVTGGTRGTWELTKDLKKGCEVVVSTPGRLIDLVRGNATNLRRVTAIVLDEADRMLDMGFEKQVGSIMENVRPDRQTLMFSATFGRRVEKVARDWLTDPVRIAIGRTGTSSEHVSQHVLVLPSYAAKKEWMMEMLPTLAGLGRMIVFVSSRADCEEIAKAMQASPVIGGKGLVVDSIHGDRHQVDRNAALASLRRGELAALVATDVAARGLDVTDVMTVVNFDCAKNLDSHVHRVGRAGRMSAGADGEHKKGVAYTLLTSKNADFANTLVEAFQREGREVSDELMALATKSRHSGGGGRKSWNKSGLGFRDGAPPTGPPQHHEKRSGGPGGSGSGTGTGGSNYYGPASGQSQEQRSKPAKRSRWGP